MFAPIAATGLLPPDLSPQGLARLTQVISSLCPVVKPKRIRYPSRPRAGAKLSQQSVQVSGRNPDGHQPHRTIETNTQPDICPNCITGLPGPLVEYPHQARSTRMLLRDRYSLETVTLSNIDSGLPPGLRRIFSNSLAPSRSVTTDI